MPRIKIEITVADREAARFILTSAYEVLCRGHLKELKVTIVDKHSEE